MKNRKRIILFSYCLIGLLACHDLDMPLDNYIPVLITTDTCLTKTLFYPDSVICTLHVEDLNDTLLKICSIVSDTGFNRSFTTDTTVQWPGNYEMLTSGYNMKKILLSLPNKILDLYQGRLLISDEYGESDTIPYRITKLLRDTFTVHSPDKNLWDMYINNDIIHVKPDYLLATYVLKFVLDSSQSCKSTGIRSSYGLRGNFCVCINFGLIELSFEKLNGVKVSFVVSTTHDTTQWAGIEAGLYLQGVQNRLRIRAAKGLDSKQFDINYYSGNMRIERKDTTVSLFCWQGDPNLIPEPIKNVTFSQSDTILYVHLRMAVDSLDCSRYCIWDNFTVHCGELCFIK